MRLIPEPPGRIVSGEILFEGKNLLRISEAEMRDIRGNAISMIFQEPMTSLNPVHRVGVQVAEAIRLHQGVGRNEARQRATGMLAKVGISDPERRFQRLSLSAQWRHAAAGDDCHGPELPPAPGYRG